MKDCLTLKWGTLKGWDLKSEVARNLAQKYFDAGDVSVSAMTRHDNDAQKAALCDLIDVIDGEIWNDWDGKVMTRDEAKAYVMGYGK